MTIYGSVMRYEMTKFANCGGCNCQSIQVTNWTAYRAQGNPTIGHWTGLSTRDAQQANYRIACILAQKVVYLDCLWCT